MRSAIIAVVWVVVLVVGQVGAQPALTPTNAYKTNGVAGPPLPPSPMELIRPILAMTVSQREAFLASKSSRHRQFLEAKLAEFDLLTAQEREERLQALQLRHYLSLLMKTPRTNRSGILASVPAPDRLLIQERLNLWDKLTPLEQKEFLEYETAVRSTVAELSRIPREIVLRTYTPWQRAQIEKQVASWNTLPSDKRQDIQKQFQEFFTLPKSQQKKTVQAMKEAERDSLVLLQQLPKAQRDRCLDGFRKFTELSPQERHEFLKAAARWKKMDESQRQTWRKLANQLPPNFPLPPGFNRPPLPPGLKRVGVLGPPSSFATN
jgi:hypothetical protein